MIRLVPLGGGVFRVCGIRRSALTGRFLPTTEASVARSTDPLQALRRANYACQAPKPDRTKCLAPAGKVDRATGLVVCNEHLSVTSLK